MILEWIAHGIRARGHPAYHSDDLPLGLDVVPPVGHPARHGHLLQDPAYIVRGLGSGGTGVHLLVVLAVRPVVDRGALAAGGEARGVVVARPGDGGAVAAGHVAVGIVAVGIAPGP